MNAAVRCYRLHTLGRRIVARHKHADLIHAWADGAQVQVLHCGNWIDTPNPLWLENNEYRVKPQPKPDVVADAFVPRELVGTLLHAGVINIHYVFDAETGALKSAEVLK